MCYSLYLSTSSDRPLDQGSYAHCSFNRVEQSNPEGSVALLQNPNRWFVGTGHECSCGFRHLTHGSIDLGFSVPVDWWDEEDEEIEATAELYRLVKSLIDSGETVDLVDSWEGVSADSFTNSEVSLKSVAESEFRLFENHRFDMVS